MTDEKLSLSSAEQCEKYRLALLEIRRDAENYPDAPVDHFRRIAREALYGEEYDRKSLKGPYRTIYLGSEQIVDDPSKFKPLGWYAAIPVRKHWWQLWKPKTKAVGGLFDQAAK